MNRPSMLTGVAWVLGLRVLDRGMGFISMMVLARLLRPEHFGVVALAGTVVGLVDLFAALGLDTILVQSRTLTRAHYDTAWTIQFGVSVFCALLLLVAAVPAMWFFREPRLGPVICALAAASLLQGARNIRLVDFRRAMRFDREFTFMAGRRLSGFVVTIPAAFLLRSEWALVSGTLVSTATGLALSYWMIPYRPKPTLALRRELLAKSNWLMASNFVMFFRARASDFVLGRSGGPAVVGVYNLASELSTIVSTELVAPINRVSLSAFSMQDSRERVVERLHQLTGQLAIVLMPLGVGLSATADLVVPILFGQGWSEAAGALEILAIAGLVAGLASNFGVALLSLGFYSRDTTIHGWGAVFLLPMVLFGALTAGTVGAAFAVLIANVLTEVVALLYMRNDIGYGFRHFGSSILWPAVAAAAMYGVVVESTGPRWEWLQHQVLLLRLSVAVGIGAITYVTALFVSWGARGFPDGPEQLTLDMARRVLRNGGRPLARLRLRAPSKASPEPDQPSSSLPGW